MLGPATGPPGSLFTAWQMPQRWSKTVLPLAISAAIAAEAARSAPAQAGRCGAGRCERATWT